MPITSHRINDIDYLPASDICDCCGAVVSIDWDSAQPFDGGGLLLIQQCGCGASVVNAIGTPTFVSFVETCIVKAFGK